MTKLDNDTVTRKLFTGVVEAEKYQSGNWVAQKLVNNFMVAILSIVKEAGSQEIHEIGCGEGHILGMLATAGFAVRGCDISNESLAVARSEAEKRNLIIQLTAKSIYDLDPSVDCSDTVICCEVLEHLAEPAVALKKLVSITRKNLIVSVPNEPIWHFLNLVRGKYLTAFGNTPGHFQHWSKRKFVGFVGEYAKIVHVYTPLPWTLIHCQPR